MEKEYVAPELEIIKFDLLDIITHSDGTSGGTPVIPPDEEDESLPEVPPMVPNGLMP